MRKQKSFGEFAKRLDYTKVSGDLELPNLIEVQTENFKWFLNEGINEIFGEIFPVSDGEGKIHLQMLDWSFKKERRSVYRAKEQGKIFEAPIYANLKLSINTQDSVIRKDYESNADWDDFIYIKEHIKENVGHDITLEKQKDNMLNFTIDNGEHKATCLVIIKSSNEDEIIVDFSIERTGEVFFGDFPLMTQKGTFIVNGSEKVVVSQLVRSPGTYFKKDINIKNGEVVYYVDLIPSRGTWLEFESELKKLRKKKKMF